VYRVVCLSSEKNWKLGWRTAFAHSLTTTWRNISNLQYKDKKDGGLIFWSCKFENEGFFYF
jgi:hypothetical protein